MRDSFAGKGYVEVISIPAEAAETRPDHAPQKEKVTGIVADCLARGYRRSDIIILTPRNSDVIEVSGWLNELGISFISHSSLDVRSRAVTGELLALLRFLDSPIDDLSFATFLLGKVFSGLLRRDRKPVNRENLLGLLFDHRLNYRHEQPLYITFRKTYPDLWRMYFEELFNVVGYLPVYDLLSETFITFDLFSLLPAEEATLAKILEVVKDFEENGENSLKGFLRFAGDSSEDADWNIDIPTDVDAVRVMTVHKAKGLESKVVVVLLYDSSSPPKGPDLEEDGDEIRLVHLTQKNAEDVEHLAALYDEKRLRNTVDDLNKLYVALTRAEEEMYVVSIQGKKSKIPSEYLPEDGYGPAAKPAVHRVPSEPEVSVELCHDLPRTPVRQVEYTGIAVAEARRGEFVHAVLEAIEYAEADLGLHLANARDRALVRVPFKSDTTKLLGMLSNVLALEALHPFFMKMTGRSVLNEQEFAGSDGALVRMDRVVVDPDVVTVIDYKTGEEKPEYSEQVLKYMKILRGFYAGRSVRGLLVYIDQQSVRTV